MYDIDNPIAKLVHLYVDGALSRRELVRRVARKTGGVAAAMAALAGFEDLRAQSTPVVPPNIRVPENDPDIEASDVSFPGEAGAVLGYLAIPRNARQGKHPAVLVVHENRGLVDHIKDVTRRVAKAGFVALGVDLLSRQGGTAQFTEATAQTAAYNRTNQFERRADLLSGLDYLKFREYVIHDRIGITGFCAGGQNTWDFAVAFEEVAAAVPFYGTPPALEDIPRIQSPVLAIYAERDRTLTGRLFPVAQAMITAQKTFGMIVYEGVGHAFHNDTGPNYNPDAAQDAWRQTIRFFEKWLRRPRE